jgi:hypothetical protein
LNIVGVVVVGILFWAAPHQGPEIQPRQARTDLKSDRASDVVPRVALHRSTPLHPVIDDGGRNPFSFRRARAVPASLTVPSAARVSLVDTWRIPRAAEAPFKFMGTLQKASGGRWAIFADCGGYTRAAKVGESVLGTWNVVRVGAESAVVESLTGERVVLAMGGCGARRD